MESTNDLKSTNEPSPEVQQALRAYLQVQEQLHTAILAIEQNRQESTATVQRNAELMSTRLKLIEQELSLQRERDTENNQKTNRLMLVYAGVFGGVGLMAMLVATFFLVRTMNRLSEISSVLPKGLGMGSAVSLSGENPIVTIPAEGTRLLGAIERLEKRIRELETGTPEPHLLIAKENGYTNGKHEEPVLPTILENPVEAGSADVHERLSVILGKGQTLLNLGQSENALVCFDEVLMVDPNHAEALVKKGTALERLRRWDEALQCYDRAIAADSGMTLAYLYKGGVFNQLERFSEALECYEQALRTQQKTAVPA